MGRITQVVGYTVGTGLGVAVAIFTLASLPLAILALMVRYGFEWWSATIVACLMHIVPLIGSLIYFVFAVFGAIDFVKSGYSFHEALNPANERVVSAKGNLRKQLVSQCTSDDRMSAEMHNKGLSLEKFCGCYVDRLFDDAVRVASGKVSDEMKINAIAASLECSKLAR